MFPTIMPWPMTWMKTKLTCQKCTSFDGGFDFHVDVPVQCNMHCPMEDAQGSTRCPWTLPKVDYLLRTTPAAAMATGNKTTMKIYTYFAGHFAGHCDALVQYCVHPLMEEVQFFTKATGHHHWVRFGSDSIRGIRKYQFLGCFSSSIF
jgi:hypothetical protein